MITEAIQFALSGSQGDLGIVADWIEDNASSHPEAGVYCRRLRDPESVRIQTIIDVIAKFGTRKERKEICRIQRIALRCRKTTLAKPLRGRITDVTSKRSRRLLNYELGHIIPREQHQGRYSAIHKKAVLSDCKKRRVYLQDPAVQNKWWFLAIIRQLLQITLSA